MRNYDEQYELLETIADIAFEIGYLAGNDKNIFFAPIGGSRELPEWIIDKAETFVKENTSKEWDGDYLEVLNSYVNECLIADKMLLPGESATGRSELTPSCNSCDTIDEFVNENSMGYCRECYREVTENRKKGLTQFNLNRKGGQKHE